MGGAELGPAARSLAEGVEPVTPPVVMPGNTVPTGVLWGVGGVDNLLLSDSGGKGVHFPVPLSCTCDGEPRILPCLDGVAITVPSAVVSILNDPIAGGGGTILTRFGELIVIRLGYDVTNECIESVLESYDC